MHWLTVKNTDKVTMLYTCLLLLGALISSISQVLLKKSALKQYSSKLKEYFNPLVILAYILFIGTTFLSILAYKVIPLSLGSILETTSYAYIMLFSVTIFHERITPQKGTALLLIIMGIIIYATI